MSAGRYEASGEAASGVGVAVIGGLMSLGFGALVLTSLLDALAFPDEPRKLTVAEAVALGEPPRDAWIELTDARLDCTIAPSYGDSGSNLYAVLVGADGQARVLVTSEDPMPASCEAWQPGPRVGVLVTIDRHRPAGLDWAALERSARWPTERVPMLATMSGPGNSWGLVALVSPLLLFGLALLVGGLRPALRRARERAGRVVPFQVPRRALAMPLSTGGAALTLVLPMASVVPILVFGPLFVAEHLPRFMTLVLGVAWAAWFFAVIGVLMEVWTKRASDVVLTPEGLAVRGGPLHAVGHRWRDLVPEHSRIDEAVGQAGAPPSTRLWLAGEVAASTEQPEERASLAAVADTVHALATQARGGQAAPSTAGPPEATSCPSCGAPLALAAVEVVTCHRCGAQVPLPPAARAQLAALQQLESARRAAEQRVRRLLAQPGATATNLLLALSIPPLFLGWPAAAIYYDELHQLRGLLTWQDGVVLFVGTFAFTYGLSWLVRAQVIGREAIRLLSTRFAARPPERQGDPPSCRSCGAALPVSTDAEQLVALCAYCHSENLLAVNLVPSARREDTQAAHLGDLLVERLARRRRLRAASVVSLGVLVASAWGLYARLAG
jgi:hypothetical protein